MDTFKTLSDAAKAAGAQTWLPQLVEANILKPSDVMARIEPDPALQMPAATWTPCGTNCRSGKPRGGEIAPPRVYYWLSRSEGGNPIPRGPTTPAMRYWLARVIASKEAKPTTTNGVGGGLLTYGDSHST